MAKVQTILVQAPGLFLAGNYSRGPALGPCVQQALAVAKAIVKNRQPGREGP